MGRVKVKHKEINFYQRYYYDPEAEAKKKMFAMAIIPVAAILVIMLGVFGFFKINDVFKKKDIKEIETYLSSPTTTQQYQESLKLGKQRDSLASTYTGMNSIKAQVDALPTMDLGTMTNINRALTGSTVVSYTYDSSQAAMVIVTKTSTAAAAPGLVKRLKNIGTFSNVNYTGYTDDDSKYVATISCTLFK